MNFFEKILNSLKATMETPKSYGWFHLMFIAIVILTTVFLCIKFKDCSDKTFKRITLIGWIIMLLLEVYKQLVFSLNYDCTAVMWDYQWYAFPYQFCSTPMLVLPFIAFFKESKFRDTLISYMATFSLFAGLAVFAYPNDVFIDIIGINIQTMVHHGMQVVFGIYFAVYVRNKLNHKYFLKGIPVFCILSLIAIILDVAVYKIFMLNGIEETFNMFYISPYFPCSLPILSIIYEKVHYSLFLVLYILGFTFVAYLVYTIEKLIINTVRKNYAKQ